jgi:hypothetical protein
LIPATATPFCTKHASSGPSKIKTSSSSGLTLSIPKIDLSELIFDK